MANIPVEHSSDEPNGERIELIYCSGPRHYVVEIDHFLIRELKTMRPLRVCVFDTGLGGRTRPDGITTGTCVFKYIELILLANRIVRLNQNLVVCYLFVVLHFQSNNEYSCKHQLILLQYTQLMTNHLKFQVNPYWQILENSSKYFSNFSFPGGDSDRLR